MQNLTAMIYKQTELIFYNMEISMKTCDWNYKICGSPVWRYFYHTLHSCDKWFRNPMQFEEPQIQEENLDKVDLPCLRILREDELWIYFQEVKSKTLAYLERLSDEELYERPLKCTFTRMELILGQYRHFMCHIGIFNGITIANTGRYPMVAGLDEIKSQQLNGKLYDE